MGLLPLQSQDLFNSAQALQGQNPIPADGFSADVVPSSTGLGSRTSSVRSKVGGTTTRKLVHWLVPEGPIVQMYCNPQQIVYNYSKNIENQRTKGGFVIQYWGEALTILDITGTTGTSGIEGINVLHDVYRGEQLAFDPFALFLAAKTSKDTFSGDIFGVESAFSSGESFLGALSGASEASSPSAAKQGPTLASLATQVEMYWSGEVYRGYFNTFTVTERAENLGLFDYAMRFTVTQKRGFRRNFLGWHRSATNGPSSSNPLTGPVHTFGRSVDRNVMSPRRVEQTSLTEGFSQIGDLF
ncbi:hypothetical protein LCGC14_0523020 [marine sediment metagenome]|uniref:Uncharacterized protein n=1 Tax=marine sediment metagenome TaxID=412755 RepID=A0A0F9UJC9_9ZZZZ